MTLGLRFVTITALLLLAFFLVDFQTTPALVLATVALVIFGVLPWLARRYTRGRMAKMRQVIKRDIHKGKLARDPASWTVYALPESTIRQLRDVTLLQVVVHKVLSRGSDQARRHRTIESEWNETASKLKRAPRKRMRMYEARWKNRVAVHLFLGTPFGWTLGIVGAIAMGVAVVARLITRPSLRLGKQLVRERLRSTRDRLGSHVRYETQGDEMAETASRPSTESPVAG